MLKKIKWILLGLASVIIIVITFLVTLVRYADEEVDALNFYRLSIEAMPEVVSVEEIHRFNGLDTYIVANVRHENGQNIYFFVQDGAVVHYFFATQLIEQEEAISVTDQLFREGELFHIQLGVIGEIPIYEVQIKDDGEVHYVVIDAQTGNVLMNFIG